MNPRDLPQAWREQAELQRSLGCTEAACTFAHCATELDAALGSYANEKLTIAEASGASGYDDETLRRLVRTGTIPNAGQPHAPRIRRRDLPRKPGHVADGPGIRQGLDLVGDTTASNGGKPRRTDEYDPEEDARGIAKLLEAKS